MTDTGTDHGTLWVCSDCITQAVTGNDMRDPDEPFDKPPLGLLDGADFSPGLCAEDHDNGCSMRGGYTLAGAAEDCGCDRIVFARTRCEGCGSRLAGERFALTLWTGKES